MEQQVSAFPLQHLAFLSKFKEQYEKISESAGKFGDKFGFCGYPYVLAWHIAHLVLG